MLCSGADSRHFAETLDVAAQPFAPFPVLAVPNPVVVVIYPLIPWVGVMAVGYAFGAFYTLDAQRRRQLSLIIGGAATGLFIVMRAINVYGDPSQ